MGQMYPRRVVRSWTVRHRGAAGPSPGGTHPRGVLL